MEEKKYLTVKDISTELGFSENWVRQQIRDKKLPALRFGKKDYRIKREDYEKFVSDHMTHDGQEE